MVNLLPQPGPILPQPGPERGAVNTVTQRHRSFASYYGDETLDPFQGNYTRILERLDPETNNGLSHFMLLEQAVGTGACPQAYLCCSNQQQRTRVYCIHLPSRFTSSLDGQVTQWDTGTFVFLGELIQGTAQNVMLPADAFRTGNNVRAKSTDYIVTHLDEITDAGSPPIPNEQEDATVVSTRRITYLPARYVPLLLDPAGYTLRQVWDILYPAIVTANDLVACAPLLKWLRVVTMGTTAVANNELVLQPSSLCITLTVPMADHHLINHRMALLKQALPYLNHPMETLELAITQMAAAVTHNTNEQRLARDDKEAKEKAPKLPSDKFTRTIAVLLELLQITDEVNLPLIWHDWANCTKRQELQVLTERLHAFTRSADAFSTCAPVVSPKLIQDLLNFTFVSDSPDNTTTGLQPFIVADGSAEHRQANLELSRMYSFLASGENALMLADLELLKSKEVASIPLTYFELERNLGMFGNLLGVVLGCNHALTQAYRSFWLLLSQGFRNEIQQIIDVKGYVKPAHILRSVQLVCYSWFIQRQNRLTPVAPDFSTIIHTLTLNTYVLPHLPAHLYRLAYPKTSNFPIIDTPSLAGTSSSSSTTGGSSNASIVSGLTSTGSGTRGTGGGTPTSNRTRGTFQVNLNPDPTLHRLIGPGVKLKELIGADPPPTLENGEQICLSYYCTPGCWSNCSRLASHAKTFNVGERSRFETYLTTQMQKLRAKQNATGTQTAPGSVPP